MEPLKTDYKNDVLDASKNQLRKYQQIQNDDGTVSFVDVTEYSTTGTSFGAKDINDTNAAVNELNESLVAINSNLSELTNDIYLTIRTSANGDIDLPVFGTSKRVIYAYNNANLFVIPRFIFARNCWGVKVLNDDWIPVANTEVTIYYSVVEVKS